MNEIKTSLHIHWRIHISNPIKKYDYMCGGTIDRLIAMVRDEDNRRADNISVANALLSYITRTNKTMSNDVFYEDKFPNGLRFKLYLAGEVEQED